MPTTEEKLAAIREVEPSTTVELGDGSRLRKRIQELLDEKKDLLDKIDELEKENAELKLQVEQLQLSQTRLRELEIEVETMTNKVAGK